MSASPGEEESGSGRAQAPAPPSKPHSVWQAVILSWLFPGTGSIMNGKTGKGLLILFCYIATIVLQMVVSVPVAILAAWGWGVVAAYNDTRRWNSAHADGL